MNDEERESPMACQYSLLGASGLGALFFGIHEVQARLAGGRHIEPPAMVFSTWVFAGTAGGLVTRWALSKAVMRHWSHRV